jgi:RNA polymerase sigma-70 factor (ECF subfamily)|tara:strand:- start:68 stop:643 length:576 start_codon:yes stop_codon:yes gene_type:complete
MKLLSSVHLQKLIEGCKKRDPECQKLLFKAFYGRMLGLCLRYSNQRDDAQDVVQEGFIRLFDKIDLYKETGSFEGWIKKIFVNMALDNLRRNKMQLISIDADGCRKELRAHEKLDQSLLDRISQEKLLEAIQNLSPVYRTVLNLHVYEGYTHDEIASELGISAGTSKSNLSKAKVNLKKMLQKYVEAKHAS